jgi:hypothetical protein
VPAAPAALAVIVAVPTDTAVTRPVELTCATDVFELDHATAESTGTESPGFPSAAGTTRTTSAVNVAVSPGVSHAVLGSTITSKVTSLGPVASSPHPDTVIHAKTTANRVPRTALIRVTV